MSVIVHVTLEAGEPDSLNVKDNLSLKHYVLFYIGSNAGT